jgi:hypothetical protein
MFVMHLLDNLLFLGYDIYKTNNDMYVHLQVSLLTSVPEFDMVQYLPEIMDGLFHILGDPNPEIRKS